MRPDSLSLGIFRNERLYSKGVEYLRQDLAWICNLLESCGVTGDRARFKPNELDMILFSEQNRELG
jgi:hypothetical protein